MLNKRADPGPKQGSASTSPAPSPAGPGSPVSGLCKCCSVPGNTHFLLHLTGSCPTLHLGYRGNEPAEAEMAKGVAFALRVSAFPLRSSRNLGGRTRSQCLPQGYCPQKADPSAAG